MGGERPYRDRSAAGRLLADALIDALADRDHDRGPSLVLALPRGGVPVAVPVARALAAELSVLLVRKLGSPGRPELAVGAIALIDGRVVRVLNDHWVQQLGLSDERIASTVAAEGAELRARATVFPPTPSVAGRRVVVVDDGLATGATMRAAAIAVRGAGAANVLVAAPVGATDACRELAEVADLVVCPRRPEPFKAVGEHYRDFAQLDDDEVLALLR